MVLAVVIDVGGDGFRWPQADAMYDSLSRSHPIVWSSIGNTPVGTNTRTRLQRRWCVRVVCVVCVFGCEA